MMADKSRTLIVCSLFIVIVAIGFYMYAKKNPTPRYVIERGYAERIRGAKLDHRQEDFHGQKTKEIFAKDIINEHTLNFLLYLDDVCKDASGLADHLEKARDYLYSILPEKTAAAIFSLYQTYLDYQIGLQEKKNEWRMPRTPQEALENLARLQEYRREVFGDEVADIIFGASVELQEYTIRRNAILYDEGLYASQKERLLRKLDEDMWGDELSGASLHAPYSRYQALLQLYKRDIAELRTEEEREAFREHLRQEVFDSVQQERIIEVERALAEEKMKKELYLAKETEILNDPDLTEEQRQEKILQLQDETFGAGAEGFRRREEMYKKWKK